MTDPVSPREALIEQLRIHADMEEIRGHDSTAHLLDAAADALAADGALRAETPSEADLRLFVYSASRYDSRVFHIEQFPWARKYLTDEQLALNSERPSESDNRALAERDQARSIAAALEAENARLVALRAETHVRMGALVLRAESAEAAVERVRDATTQQRGWGTFAHGYNAAMDDVLDALDNRGDTVTERITLNGAALDTPKETQP